MLNMNFINYLSTRRRSPSDNLTRCSTRIDVAVCYTHVIVFFPDDLSNSIVIPIKKLLLSEEQLSKPIPTLSDRQFVVQKSQLSDKELRTQLELFWYREELFKCVRGRWREVRFHTLALSQTKVKPSQTGGIRSGELSLRQQRMTQPMVKTLRMEEARVHMSLVSYNPSHGTDKLVNYRGGKYYPAPQEFVYLRIKITNLSRTLFANFALIFVTHAILPSITSHFHCRSGGGTCGACRTRGRPY